MALKRLALLVLLLSLACANAVSVTVTGEEEIDLSPAPHYSDSYLETATVYRITGLETGKNHGDLHVDKGNIHDIEIALDREISFDFRNFPFDDYFMMYSDTENFPGPIFPEWEGCTVSVMLENSFPRKGKEGRKDTFYLPSYEGCRFSDRLYIHDSDTETGEVCSSYAYRNLGLKDGDSLLVDGTKLYVNGVEREGTFKDYSEEWASKGVRCPGWTGPVTNEQPQEPEDEIEPAPQPEPQVEPPVVSPEPEPVDDGEPEPSGPLPPPEPRPSGPEIPTEGWQGVFAKVLLWFFDFADSLGAWLG